MTGLTPPPLHVAEASVRDFARCSQWPIARELTVVLAEYDRRGVELDSRAAVHATTTTEET